MGLEEHWEPSKITFNYYCEFCKLSSFRGISSLADNKEEFNKLRYAKLNEPVSIICTRCNKPNEISFTSITNEFNGL